MRSFMAFLLLLLSPALGAQSEKFLREGSGGMRKEKDALEGKLAPAIKAKNWMNTDGQALSLEALRGKVVVLDFWGTW